MNKVFKYCPLFLIAFALLLFSGCRKDSNEVPNVFVDIYLYSTDPAFAPLNAVTGYAYLAGGSRGILVFRKSQTEFLAFDRHCTFQAANGNAVTVDAGGLLAEDPSCGSKFLLTAGIPNQGPAINSLRQYQTAFDGSVLHIFN